MSALLDVNVLVALAWPNHVHHAAAVEWFRAHRAEGWATCPLTESGFLRVSTNRRAIPAAVTVAEALALLRAWRSQPGHEAWTDDAFLADAEEIDLARVVGHRQVTDGHLLVLALRHGGRLVTFDRAVVSLAPDPDRVILLRA